MYVLIVEYKDGSSKIEGYYRTRADADDAIDRVVNTEENIHDFWVEPHTG